MKKAALLAVAALASGCSSGPPAREVREFQGFRFDRDRTAVREACRAAFREERCPIESDTESVLATPVIEDVGFTWRLTVDLRPAPGSVSVEPSLEIRRSADYDPPRRARAVSPFDDPASRSAGREGSLTERQMSPRAGGDPLNERENRIRELDRRINRIVDAVARRLSAKS